MDNIFSIFPSKILIDLVPYQYGYEKCESAHSFGPARRNNFLFHYVLSGCGELHYKTSSGIKSAKVAGKQGFMIFPEVETMYVSDAKEPWEYVWIEFNGTQAAAIVQAAGLSQDNPIYKTSDKEALSDVANQMLYIVRHHNENPLCIMGHVYLWADALRRGHEYERASHQGDAEVVQSVALDFHVKEATVYIERNYQRNISIEEVADACGLGRAYFSKVFKTVLGVTPHDFLLKYRIQKAQSLLLSTNYSVNEVASKVGYMDALSFSRAFKNMCGTSPRQWKATQNHAQ